MGFPLMVRAIRLSIEAVDSRLEEAAGTLGANRAWVFLTVTLPLILPGIIAGMILCFAKAIGEFGATITFVSNIPGETQTLPVGDLHLHAGAGRRRRRAAPHAASRSPSRLLALLASELLARRVSRRCWTSHDARARHQAPAGRASASTPASTAGRGLTALFGRSGAGKTTLVNVIAGLIRPDHGRVVVDGATLVDTERGVFVPHHKRRVGYVFQEGRLFPHLTVRQNLLYGRWFAPQAERRRRSRRGRRPARHRTAARAAAGEAFGRREAARRDRPRAARQPAPAADGRAAGLARRGAQGRDPALHRAPARRERGADRLCQPLRRRGGAACHDRGAAVGGRGRRRRARPRRSCSGSTSFRSPAAPRPAPSSRPRWSAHDDASGLTELRSRAGPWRLPRLDVAPGERLRLRVRARDVMLATKRAGGHQRAQRHGWRRCRHRRVARARSSMSGSTATARRCSRKLTRYSVGQLGLAAGRAGLRAHQERRLRPPQPQRTVAKAATDDLIDV